VPVTEVFGCQHLRLASRCKLNIPQFHCRTFSIRAFSVAGPTVWNSLPDSLHDPAVECERFRRDLKTHFFARYWDISILEVSPFHGIALCKSTFTYLLTYQRHMTLNDFCHCTVWVIVDNVYRKRNKYVRRNAVKNMSGTVYQLVYCRLHTSILSKSVWCSNYLHQPPCLINTRRMHLLFSW